MKKLRVGMGLMLLMAAGMLAGCTKKQADNSMTNKLVIVLDNKAGTNPLSLGTAFVTPQGETITPTIFKYYLSNFSLVKADGTELPLPGYYYLIDESKADSKTIFVNTSDGQYKELRFIVGVDSARNVSGVQSGALDPVNEMFWTWNTGYIMAKFEGRSTVSPAPLQAVTYHIGGFKGAESVLKKISIPFNQSITLNMSSSYKVFISADVLKWFRGSSDISVVALPTVTEPGSNALKVSANYANMFSLTSVQKQ